MKTSFSVTLALVSGLSVFLIYQTPSLADDQVKRGEYLLTLGGCNDCHSPKIFSDQGMAPDPDKLLSGAPSSNPLPPPPPKEIFGPDKWGVISTPDLTTWLGPWGVSFAVNLTPDPDTGLGNWTLEQFTQTMRTGKHLGTGRPILPPMPWFALRHLTDQDIGAIFAYLGSIPPISNRVHAPIPPGG